MASTRTARVAAALMLLAGGGAGLAAGVAGWRYWHDAGAAQAVARPLPNARTTLADADLFREVPDRDRRARAPFPIEFETQFPLIAAQASAEAVPVLPSPRTARPQKLAHRDCAPRCEPAALAGVTPPRRPEALRLASLPPPVVPQAEAGEEEPVRILGVAIPPVVPAGKAAIRTVAEFGTGVKASLGDLIDVVR